MKRGHIPSPKPKLHIKHRKGIPYFYKSIRENGKVKVLYIGNQAKATQYIKQETERLLAIAKQSRAESQLAELQNQLKALIHHALIIQGFHRPNYGPYRKKRTNQNNKSNVRSHEPNHRRTHPTAIP